MALRSKLGQGVATRGLRFVSNDNGIGFGHGKFFEPPSSRSLAPAVGRGKVNKMAEEFGFKIDPVKEASKLKDQLPKEKQATVTVKLKDRSEESSEKSQSQIKVVGRRDVLPQAFAETRQAPIFTHLGKKSPEKQPMTHLGNKSPEMPPRSAPTIEQKQLSISQAQKVCAVVIKQKSICSNTG